MEGLDHVLSLANFLVIDRSLEDKILSILPDGGNLSLHELRDKLDSTTDGGLRFSELRETLDRLALEGKVQLDDTRVTKLVVDKDSAPDHQRESSECRVRNSD